MLVQKYKIIFYNYTIFALFFFYNIFYCRRTYNPWPNDAICREFVTRFSTSRRRKTIGIFSFPNSGNTLMRQLVEAATGVFTGSFYSSLCESLLAGKLFWYMELIKIQIRIKLFCELYHKQKLVIIILRSIWRGSSLQLWPYLCYQGPWPLQSIGIKQHIQ